MMKYKNIIIMLLLFSTTFILVGINPIKQNFTVNHSSKKSSSHNNDLLQYPLTSTWMPNGSAVCVEGNDSLLEGVCSDGAGGAIIVWEDNRTGSNNRAVYAQKINSTGDIQWDTDGVAICIITNYNNPLPVICSDGLGGAIIAWVDNRSGNEDIYAQRIDSNGAIHTGWDPDGVAICTNLLPQMNPQIISDENNGAIIVWGDYRNGISNPDIYGQKVDSTGDIQWDPDGVAICTYSSYQILNGICTDGLSGAIVIWSDDRLGVFNIVVYAQRVDATGISRWNGTEGIAICNITNNNDIDLAPTICSDENYGAIIAWSDNRTGKTDPYRDIYAQKVDTNGNTLWTEQGVLLCNAIFDQLSPEICNDGAGGAIIVWKDERVPALEENLYAQKVNSQGILQWAINGIAVCTADGTQRLPCIAKDGMGGALIVWQDLRKGDEKSFADIYAQHINSKGNIKWISDGKVICNADNGQISPLVIYETGSVIIAWEDRRNGEDNDDIYAQRIKLEGAIITPSDGGGGGGGKKKESQVPGYDILFVIITSLTILGIVSLKFYRKYQKGII